MASSAIWVALIGMLLACLYKVDAYIVHQQPLPTSNEDPIHNIIDELKRAEIIPTVLDEFIPAFVLGVEWTSRINASLGNTLKPKKLKHRPLISLSAGATAISSRRCQSAKMTYVVTLTDPDAPSRDDPAWSEMAHWAASGVSGTAVSGVSGQHCGVSSLELKDILSYKPPGPPKKTGKHRYIFTVFAPANSTSAPLNLTRPSERQHWGLGKERHGVRDWSKSNGLVPIAANFVYSQHKKQ